MFNRSYGRLLPGLAVAAMLSWTTGSQATDAPTASGAKPAASAAMAKKSKKPMKSGADIKAGGSGPELDCTTKPHGAGKKGPGIPKCPQDLAPAAAGKP